VTLLAKSADEIRKIPLKINVAKAVPIIARIAIYEKAE
jgi:hypothetical protein